MRFSVIIPLYNKAAYVERAVKSVLSQTFDDYELIIVDDGSTDGSADIIMQMEENDRQLSDLKSKCRFVFIKQKNSGAGAARNNGAGIAHGEYFCFLDADDWWTDCFLQKVNDLIEAYPEAGAYGTAYYYYKNARGRVLDYALPTGFKSGYINYCRCYADSMRMPLWTGAVSIPCDIFEEFSGFSEMLTLGEDFYLWIRIALKYKVAFLNKPLSYYNNDVPVAKRAVGKLHTPAKHMLWGLLALEHYESTNKDYKYLIDKLRVNSLYPYYLDKDYRKAAVSELQKVDWKKQPLAVRMKYRLPPFCLILWQRFRVFGSRVKQWGIKMYRVLI